jgi:hypothetical protein
VVAFCFSEDEPIEFTKKYVDKIDWVWIDCPDCQLIDDQELLFHNLSLKAFQPGG